jgi:beta-mannosidase
VDHFLRPKLAWYAIKRELRPINVTISRTSRLSSVQEANNGTLKQGNGEVAVIEIWGSNATLEEVEVVLKVECFDITSGRIVSTAESGTSSLPPNQSTLLMEIPLEYDPPNTVICASFTPLGPSDPSALKSTSTTAMRSSANWHQPLKYLDFSDRRVSFSVEGEEITLKAEKPTKGVILDVEGDDSRLEWSDNGFDIMPGEIAKVIAKGLGDRKVVVNWYGA